MASAPPFPILIHNTTLLPPTPISTFLSTTHGAYTTTRTHLSHTLLLFYPHHLRRLAHSHRILSPHLPLPPLPSLINPSLRAAFNLIPSHHIPGTELSITVLVHTPDDHAVDVYVHVNNYDLMEFGVAGARLAVAGPGRAIPQAKWSGWARVRRGLEKMRPPGATELLLTNDGDRILEGSLTNFFVVCRRVITGLTDDDPDREIPFEVQTAPISDGVLPGVIREQVIEICTTIGIPLREVAPSWSEHELWTEAFVTSSLRLMQHVETIEIPLSCKELQSKAWTDVSWSTKRFEAAGLISSQIERELQERARSCGYPISDVL